MSKLIKQTQVLGLGDNVVDHYLHENIMYPGGNSFNFAAYAKFLGYKSAYLGVFGDDEAAELVLNTANTLGIETNFSIFENGENGRARVFLKDGDRQFLPSNKGGVSREKPFELNSLSIEYCKKFDLIHSSCFSYCEYILPVLKEQGLKLSFDFSDVFTNDYLEKVCPNLYSAVFSASHLSIEEINMLIEKVSSMGVTLINITRGSDGAYVYYKGNVYRQTACLVEPIDTMGSGDSFYTTLVCSLIEGMKFATDFPENENSAGIVSISEYEDTLIKMSLYKAAVFASQVCMEKGAFGYGKMPISIIDRVL